MRYFRASDWDACVLDIVAASLGLVSAAKPLCRRANRCKDSTNGAIVGIHCYRAPTAG